MQEYLSETNFGEKTDNVCGTVLIMLGCVLFFALLWGLRLSAVLSGAAMGTMFLLLRERGRKRRLRRRETALRRRIGGEMKLEEWTISSPRRAHAEAALLLSQVSPVSPERVTDDGAVCTNKNTGQKIMIFCARLHRKEKLTARDIAAFQRICIREETQKGLVCGSGEMTKEAEEQAQLEPVILRVEAERMIALAGAAWPATDEQLIALGKRKKRSGLTKGALRDILSPGRSRKYLLYGLLLCLLYLFSGLMGYLIPGCICLVLMALCRTGRFAGDPSFFL